MILHPPGELHAQPRERSITLSLVQTTLQSLFLLLTIIHIKNDTPLCLPSPNIIQSLTCSLATGHYPLLSHCRSFAKKQFIEQQLTGRSIVLINNYAIIIFNTIYQSFVEGQTK